MEIFSSIFLFAASLSAPAYAYEKREVVDSLIFNCQVQGAGLNEPMKVHASVVRGLAARSISAGVAISPGVYDENYNPGGSKNLLALLVKNLGTPRYAFVLNSINLEEKILKSDKTFPKTLAFENSETSWTNSSDSPDVILSY